MGREWIFRGWVVLRHLGKDDPLRCRYMAYKDFCYRHLTIKPVPVTIYQKRGLTPLDKFVSCAKSVKA